MAFRKRLNFKDFFYNQYLIAFCGIIVIVLISYPLAKNLSKTHIIDQEINDLKKEIYDLNLTNSELKKAINFIESNDYLEKEARLNMGLRKPGEKVVVIKEKENEIVYDQVDGAKSFENSSNYKKWINYFFNIYQNG
jgi:cell division protein FtsB